MEPTEEVLVVIQAESGEEIALPLAALDEQHQEVVVESNGTSSIVDATNSERNNLTVLQQHHNLQDGDPNVQHETHELGQNHEPLEDEKQQLLQLQQQFHTEIPQEQAGIQIITAQDQHIEQQHQLDDQQHVVLADVQEAPQIESIPVPRQKQKRKEKLVCLPLSDEDLELEFQFVEEPVQQVLEEVKRKPRKEYRTKKKLAALEAAKERETSTSNGQDKDHASDHSISTNNLMDERTNTSINSNHNYKRRKVAKDDKPVEVAQSTPKHHRQRDKSPQQKQQNPHPLPTSPEKISDAVSKCQIKLDTSTELSPQALKFDQIPSQPLPERRTRLSNVCRVATGKSYRCHDCGYSTERINNISLHIKKACPKLFANQ